MVELLAGPLIGDMTSAESLAWDNGAGGFPYGGELILALDPQRFLGAQAQEQLARAETLFKRCRRGTVTGRAAVRLPPAE